MEREYKNTDEILDYLDIIPVLDESGGISFDLYFDEEQVGSFNRENSEIEVNVKVAEDADSNENTDSAGIYWEYSQSTRELTYVDNQTGERTLIGIGYSGNGAGLNNPDMQDIQNVGPIPQGIYDIGDATTTRGPLTLPLTPHQGTDTFGRDNFRIHGDNSSGDQSASQGCVILRRSIREQINNSEVSELRVVR